MPEETVISMRRRLQLVDKFFSFSFKFLRVKLVSKRLSKPTSAIAVSHADHLSNPNNRTHKSPTSHTPLPIVNGSNVLPLGRGPASGKVCRLCTGRSKPLASPIECFPPPPPLADATSQSRTHTPVLQGTISALKLIQQIVGLAPVPGLGSLVGVVLNILEVVNDKYAAEDALVELAHRAGSFMVTLVSHMEPGSITTFSDPDSMNSVIEGLTKEMYRVLGVVNKISSQRLPKRFLLSTSDRATVDECNRHMSQTFGLYGIQIAFISQKAIARMETKLNLIALAILQESNKQTTTAQKTSTC